MLITAIDPGPRLSAYVVLRGDVIIEHGKMMSLSLLQKLRQTEPQGPLVIEMIAPYGKPVSYSVFDTCIWIGRYLEAWRGVGKLVTRQDVKKVLCGGRMRATDADVRKALIALWSRKVAVSENRVEWVIGSKQHPGPLWGIVRDQWAALAVAVAWREKHAEAFAAVEEAPLSGLEELNRLAQGPYCPDEDSLRDPAVTERNAEAITAQTIAHEPVARSAAGVSAHGAPGAKPPQARAEAHQRGLGLGGGR